MVEQEAPSHWVAPSGARHRIDYQSGAPVVAVRLQEVFGTPESPRLGAGAVPLTFELLTDGRVAPENLSD